MMRPVHRFEAEFVPRFEGENFSRRQIELLCAQRTFWSAIQELLSSSRDVTASFGEPAVELRYVAEPTDHRNRLLLNIRNVDSSNQALQSLVRVLPSDYGWQPVVDAAGEFASPNNLLPREWHVVRVERRLNFIDLPWRRVDSLDTSGARGSERDAVSLMPWSALDTQERQLVTRQLVSGELETERYCLPVSGAIEIDPRSLRLLFQELRSQRPCVVSISLARVDSTRLDKYRRIAALWSAHLQPFGTEIANAGLADPETLRAQYDRFLLPDRFLCVLTMQVAAATPVAARSVALQLTGRLGGLRCFLIRDPAIAPLDILGDPWNDAPHLERWSPEQWVARHDRLRRETARDGLDIDVLEPVFTEFLIELPHIYTIDEAQAVTALPVADAEGLPGLDTRLVAPFSDPSRAGAVPVMGACGQIAPPPAGRLRVGIAPVRDAAVGTSADARGEWHTLAPRDLTKHAFVVGSTGSGKTVTTLFLVRELARLSIPFLIVEPVKTEYYDQLKKVPGLKVRRFNFEGTREAKPHPDFLAFDPMRLQEGVSVARHASYLKSCFEAAFPLDPATAQLLETGIRRYYQHGCKLDLFRRGGEDAHHVGAVHLRTGDTTSKTEPVVHPSLRGFRHYLLNVFLPAVFPEGPSQNKAAAEHRENIRQWFERRFESLMSGLIGRAADRAEFEYRTDRANYNPFSRLLSGSCVLELDGIPDEEQKALMMAFIMTFLFERRQADDLLARELDRSTSDDLRHVLVLEEAHRILASTPQGGRGDLVGGGAQAKSVSLFVDMLAEIRAFGQGLVIVEQIPTKIVSEAVKNTNLKIMLRLTAADDREYLGAAMNFTEEQKRFVTSLRAETGRGIDMVVFEQQLDQPRLLSLPLPPASGRPVHEALFELPIWRRH